MLSMLGKLAIHLLIFVIWLAGAMVVFAFEVVADVLSDGELADDDPLDNPLVSPGPGYTERHEFFWETGTKDDVGYTWSLDGR